MEDNTYGVGKRREHEISWGPWHYTTSDPEGRVLGDPTTIFELGRIIAEDWLERRPDPKAMYRLRPIGSPHIGTEDGQHVQIGRVTDEELATLDGLIREDLDRKA